MTITADADEILLINDVGTPDDFPFLVWNGTASDSHNFNVLGYNNFPDGFYLEINSENLNCSGILHRKLE